MSIEKILAISGKPGLYELKVQTRTGFVAESLIDGKKITVGLRNNVSLLTEISVYTYNEEVRLAEVFRAIAEKEDNGPAISHKEDNAKLEEYFREVLPEYDEDRVYVSDIKKIVNWYNLLQSKGLVSKETPAETATEAEAPEVTEAAEAKTEE
ncbi:DUF5606 family protein [Flavobacterium rhizosphaerae]|uniref:DUF5606 domain-containing protein n=1 Tax=Flavobacterium rhizosphaerae TaxID=3163298 RepID=A0ABW8YVQ5_9FLAO